MLSTPSDRRTDTSHTRFVPDVRRNVPSPDRRFDFRYLSDFNEATRDLIVTLYRVLLLLAICTHTGLC